MSKEQIYFGPGDQLGAGSNLTSNFWNHCGSKGPVWGSDKQVRKLFPRGKAYDNLHLIQFKSHVGDFEDE